MKLETRVEQLEHEIRILKNEIQHTLLEIQEQILIHYYPSLRATEKEDVQQMAAVLDSLRAKPKEEPTHRNGHGVIPGQAGIGTGAGAEMDSSESLDYEELFFADPFMAEAEIREIERTSLPDDGASRPAGFSQVADWVTSTVEKIGKEQTKHAVEVYIAGGYMDPDTKSMILQLIALSREGNLAEQDDSFDMVGALVELDKALGGAG